MLAPHDVALARALERCEVPAGGFPHAAHLRVAWVYLIECGSVDAAIARMAATLRSFSAAVGQAGKYSDAVTAFWMLQLAAVRAVMPAAGIDAVLSAYPRLLDKNLIRPDAPSHVITPDSVPSSSNAPHRPVPGDPA